jgi:hypothetical protein
MGSEVNQLIKRKAKKMNETIKLSIVEMELAAMWSKLQSMSQTMVKSSDSEFAQLQQISDQIDTLRRQVGVKIEMANH